MPHSIFFHKGYAIHGTIHVSRLGRRASHGCVRLHPANAATLFALVRNHGATDTRIFVGHGAAVASGSERRRGHALSKARGEAVAEAADRGAVFARAKARPARADPLMDLSGW
jgi:hypothetical protein